MKYDIFISCKSEDYPFARKVYQYLREHNYHVFLADTELRKKGNAEYGEIIDDALDSAIHMVIIATKTEYIQSTYVKSEWRTFIEEKRSGRKMGNIITLIEFNISELPISLRHFQSFNINSYHQITDYLPLFSNRKESTNDFNVKYDKKDFQNIKPQYNVAEPFLMAIEDAFHIVGRGMVATGRIGAGKISVGDTLNIIRFGDKIKATCVGIEHKRKLIESAEAGENSYVGLLLRGLEPYDIKRGHVLTKSESISSSKRFSCDCLFFDKIISPRLTFYILTMDVRGNISFASNSNIQSYEIVPAIISLDIPAPIIEHTHFAIRYKDKTVGVGIIKQNLP